MGEEKKMPTWNKVQLSDEAIRSAATKNSISTESAFDLLLDLIENAEHAKYKGSDPDGVELYRLENEYLYISGQLLVNYSRRKGYSLNTIYKVHEAEDGRCEECGRGMDKKVARVKRIDMTIFNDLNNYALLCPDCNKGRPDLLENAIFEEKTIKLYQDARNISLPEAQHELLTTKNNLVIIKEYGSRTRYYWAVGLGVFLLQDGSLKIKRLYEEPKPLLEKNRRTDREGGLRRILWAVTSFLNI